MQNMIWIVTHRKEQFFSSASAQSSLKLQKDDGRYPNRLVFLITDCNYLPIIKIKTVLHLSSPTWSSLTVITVHQNWY